MAETRILSRVLRSSRARAAILLAALALPACAVEDQAGPTPSPSGAAGSRQSQLIPPPSSTPTPTPTTTPTPEPRRLTLVATGDILLHERLWTQARRDATGGAEMNFAPQLASIKPVVDGASAAICHLETPLAPPDGPYSGYPAFSAPPQIVPALVETGYDACTTASNHTFDDGAEGVDRTLDMLDSAGLEHAGSARSQQESAEPTLLTIDTPAGPVTLGLLSYTYGFNGIPYPGGETWRSNRIDEQQIRSDAAAARSAGAEFVVVSLHWGDEYTHEPNAQQAELAPRLVASPDIDLLLGHHAHVVQPLEHVDGEWVVYGLGNLMAAHRTPGEPQNEGMLVRFTVTENLSAERMEVTAAEFLPLLQTDDFPVGVVNVADALNGGDAGTAGRSRLQTAMDRTTEIVGRRGGLDDGARLLGE